MGVTLSGHWTRESQGALQKKALKKRYLILRGIYTYIDENMNLFLGANETQLKTTNRCDLSSNLSSNVVSYDNMC